MKFEKLSDAEMTVMNLLWEMETPTRASWVLKHLDTGWALSTVKTLLDRLVKKQVVSMSYQKRFRYYAPTCSKEEFFLRSVGDLSGRLSGFSPFSQIASFIDGDHMSEEELDEIESLLQKARERARLKGNHDE